jgi:uncharacterized membrane protein YfcA
LIATPSVQMSELVLFAVALLLAGAVVGLLAGLFGIGGGTVVVPVLYETFGWFDISEDVRMPLCIGTSLAVIVPTSIASFIAHRKNGSVDMDVLRRWLLPVVAGVLIGALLARIAPAALFKVVFIAVALTTAIRLLWGDRMPRLGHQLPRGGPMAGYGLTIGASASLMGIGGGLLANMVMTLHGRAIHQAVATSAGIGVLVSLPGALGYVLAGWDRTGLPPMSLGFVSITGMFLLMPASIVTARVGVSLAHRLSKAHLELALAAYLIAVCARFSMSLAAS